MRSKKVVDNNTGITYPSLLNAAENLGVKYTTLHAMITGRNTNKLNVAYYGI